MTVTLNKKRALVTGGTRGLGKAIGMELARAGVTVYLTHRWGNVSDEEVQREFKQAGLKAPVIIESDVSDADDINTLMEVLCGAGGVDIIVSNVSFAKVAGPDLADLKKNALDLSLNYSAWPLVSLAQAALAITGRYPRYMIAVSSDGAEVCHPGYDFAGSAKSVLETMCRFLALRLKPSGVRVNAIRPGFLDTASARETFGDDVMAELKERYGGLFLDPHAVAGTCVALCSGLMDAVTGQTIVVDEGWSLVSPIAYLTGGGMPKPFPSGENP